MRATDRDFFQRNLLSAFLPTRYHLSGLLENEEAAAQVGGGPVSGAGQAEPHRMHSLF